MSRIDEIADLERVKSAIHGNNEIKINACNCDVGCVARIFNEAKSNDDQNRFPDFLFLGGGIELFEVTSSKDSKKGSSFRIDEKEGDKRIEENFGKQPYKPGCINVLSANNVYTDFSYTNFVFSLKKHFLDHIDSLRKSNTHGTIVFLIKQHDARMWIYNEHGFERFYLLSKDKELLSFLKGFSKEVSYIVFLSGDSLEIIDTSKIDSLIDNAIECKNVSGGRLIKQNVKLIF